MGSETPGQFPCLCARTATGAFDGAPVLILGRGRGRIGRMKTTISSVSCVLGLGVVLWGSAWGGQDLRLEPLADGVLVLQGAVNGLRIERNGQVLAVYGDPRTELTPVETVLFTHHRRDVVWAGAPLVQRGARAVGPAAEMDEFANVGAFWDNFQLARFHDYSQKSTKVLGTPLTLERGVSGGDAWNWEGIPIRVLDTPGFTRGAVSYLIDVAGTRVACTGDLIYGDGQILDLYSLQDAIPTANIWAYHGYAARLADVIASLQKLADEHPTVIVPCRGPVIRDPELAIAHLIARAQAVYANYLSIDAHHYYSQDEPFLAKARRVLGADANVQWQPFAATVEPLPPWIIAIDNARLIVSEDKTGFLVDCGSQHIIDEVEKLRTAGTISAVEQIFVTHYHDDHTDHVGLAAEQFHVTVCASEFNRDILERPGEYRVPCLTMNPLQVTRLLPSGTRWRWKEFEMTIYYFPGQTLYHDALLVKKDSGEQYFFIGDSFTPSGIDDYCLLNRNWLHPATGFRFCLEQVKQVAPEALLINQHVGPAFRFSVPQLDTMQQVLAERVELLRALVPWDDPNFAIDESWARFHPYACPVKPGAAATLTLRILNHSPREQTFTVTPHLPPGWTLSSPSTVAVPIAALKEGTVAISCVAPEDALPGVQLMTADLAWSTWDLREWTEAMLIVKGP